MLLALQKVHLVSSHKWNADFLNQENLQRGWSLTWSVLLSNYYAPHHTDSLFVHLNVMLAISEDLQENCIKLNVSPKWLFKGTYNTNQKRTPITCEVHFVFCTAFHPHNHNAMVSIASAKTQRRRKNQDVEPNTVDAKSTRTST